MCTLLGAAGSVVGLSVASAQTMFADAPFGEHAHLRLIKATLRAQEASPDARRKAGFRSSVPPSRSSSSSCPTSAPRPTTPTESTWADLRESQRRAVAADPHAALAVTIDLGEPADLHPANKRDVGRRLARAARHIVYGEAIAPSGPIPLSATRVAAGVVVTFGDVDGRLVTYSANIAAGFELCGAGPASCRYVAGEVDGSRVTLPVAPRDGAPVRVRFCWGASPTCNLSDLSALPAGPFEIPIE